MLMNEWAGCIYGLLYIRRNKRGVGAGKRLCEHWERGWWELEADVKYDTTLLCKFYEIKVKVANIRQITKCIQLSKPKCDYKTRICWTSSLSLIQKKNKRNNKPC